MNHARRLRLINDVRTRGVAGTQQAFLDVLAYVRELEERVGRLEQRVARFHALEERREPR